MEVVTMLLCDETIWAIPDGASGIEFSDKEVGKAFIELFNNEWNVAVEAVASEHKDCLRDNPATVEEKGDSLLVTFVPLDIPFMDGEYCDIVQGCDALERAVAKLKENYPDIYYKGCVQFAWSDAHGGDVIKFDISSEDDGEPYAFVGEILKAAVEDEEEYFWEQVEDVDELEEIAEDLENYKEWVGEDALERIAEIQENQ